MRLASRPQQRAGFTLMEILVVLALMALIAFLSYPSFQAWTQSQKMRDGVDNFRVDLVKARTKAMEQSRAYRCSWDVGSGGYRIAPDEVEFWPNLADAANGPTSSGTALEDAPWIQEQTLPEGVTFLGASANPLEAAMGRSSVGGSGGGEYLVFQADGSATVLLPDGTEAPQIDIAIGAVNGEQRVLRLRAVTSVMTIFNPRLP
jgi:prepilin-type N-terminal cleavage/methylation domain-containing protein